MRRRAHEPVLIIPHVGAADFLHLLICVGAEYQNVAPKIAGAGSVAGFTGDFNIDVVQPLGLAADDLQGQIRVPLLGRPNHALGAAGSRKPDVEWGLLRTSLRPCAEGSEVGN